MLSKVCFVIILVLVSASCAGQKHFAPVYGQETQESGYFFEGEEDRSLKNPVVCILDGLSEKVLGSGVIVSRSALFYDGARLYRKYYLLSANHTVRGMDFAYIRTLSGDTYEAKICMRNDVYDIAVLVFESNKIHRQACVRSVGLTGRVQLGDNIYLVSYPRGIGPFRECGEVLSREENLITINAPGYLGSSGGGVFLVTTGELIGVYTKMLGNPEAGEPLQVDVGYVTPLHSIIRWVRGENCSFVFNF
ncbi:MAG: serine protease [Patescibacteria group bacterium]